MHEKCDSDAAYQQHLRLGEPTCQTSRDAHRAYQRGRQEMLLQKRARERAHRRVSLNHPEEFSQCMAEEIKAERQRLVATLLEA